jgi:peptidoglycan/LPS O-acetylase OafA/YrhL
MNTPAAANHHAKPVLTSSTAGTASGLKVTKINSLDSLRGAAAFVVLCHHLLLIQPAAWLSYSQSLPFRLENPWSWIYATPLSLLVNGQASVLIFFVLSGLVLALSFVGRDRQDYAPFLIKRFTRLWPAFAVAILISAGLQWLAGRIPPAGVSNWFLGSWNVPPSLQVVAQHLELTQFLSKASGELDNPMWSLVHELRISLIFPALVFFAFRWPFSATALSIVLMPICFVILGSAYRDIAASFADTGIYIWLFVAGAVLAANLQIARNLMASLSRPVWTAVWIASLALLMFAKGGDIYPLHKAAKLLAAGMGAIAIVAMCTGENRITRLLETPLPAWLGKVSYSLYLIHVPAMLTVFYLFPGAPYLLNAGISLLCALAMAEVLYRRIEAPSMRIGRNWARQFLRRDSRPAGLL